MTPPTDALVAQLLDRVAADNARRPHFTDTAISREAAGKAIDAILWLYGSRSSDAAGVYAWDALMKALGIDW